MLQELKIVILNDNLATFTISTKGAGYKDFVAIQKSFTLNSYFSIQQVRYPDFDLNINSSEIGFTANEVIRDIIEKYYNDGTLTESAIVDKNNNIIYVLTVTWSKHNENKV